MKLSRHIRTGIICAVVMAAGAPEYGPWFISSKLMSGGSMLACLVAGYLAGRPLLRFLPREDCSFDLLLWHIRVSGKPKPGR